MSKKARSKMIEENRKAFEKELPKLLKKHRDKYALMRDKKIVKVYPTTLAAWEAGQELYEDEMYSIQKITDVPRDLGIYSRVVPLRPL